MGIEEVRIGAATMMLSILVNLWTYVGEQLAVYLISLVGTMQTSPEVDSPTGTPAGRIVALDFQSLGCGCSKLGCLCYRNLVERIETEQVRLMAVMPILVIPIVIPLHQVASLSDVVRTQAIEGCLQLLQVIAVDTQGFRSLDSVLEELTDDGKVGGSSIETAATIAFICNIVCFWRSTRSCNQFVWIVWIRNKPLQQEVGSALHQRIGCIAEIFRITGIVVVIPEGFYKPGSTHRPVAPLRALVSGSHRVAHRPRIGIVSGAPSLIDAVEVLGIVATCYRQAFYQSIYRSNQLGKIGNFCRPVIFFQIDVDGIVATPWRTEGWCPKSLQIGWYSLGAATADEQVSAILEIELFQIRVVLVVVAIGEQLLVGRAGSIKLGTFQVQAYSIKEFPVISDMALLEFIIGEVGKMPGIIRYSFDIRSPFLHRVLVEAIVARFVDEIDDSLAYIFQMEH